MLNRCKEILQKYAHDERLHGKCPLPRYEKKLLSYVFNLKEKTAFLG
jgi:hypothetical protein